MKRIFVIKFHQPTQFRDHLFFIFLAFHLSGIYIQMYMISIFLQEKMCLKAVDLGTSEILPDLDNQFEVFID